MFSWLISLLLLFGSHGKAATVTSAGLDNSGNRHVAPADNPQPSPPDPFNVDGQGGTH
jgi:hypothetical protein